MYRAETQLDDLKNPNFVIEDNVIHYDFNFPNSDTWFVGINDTVAAITVPKKDKVESITKLYEKYQLTFEEIFP